MPTIKKICIHVYKPVTIDKCATAKYGLGLVCREVKRLGNAGLYRV